MDRSRTVAGVDVGGTKVAVARLSGTDLHDASLEATEVGSPEALLGQIARMVGALGPVDAVGVGVPSVLDRERGHVLSTTNIQAFRDLALRDELAERCGVPVHVDNDGNLAALAEAWDDELRLVSPSLLCLTIGTGVGAGYVLDGRPLRGRRTTAMEAGHLLVAADLRDGAPEAAGFPHPASIEAWGSGRALDRLADERGLPHGAELTALAHDGDERAVEALRILGGRIAAAVGGIVDLLDPELVVIGGGASSAGELLVAPIRETFGRFTLPGLGERTEVRVARHGPEAGVRGAALLALQETTREGTT